MAKKRRRQRRQNDAAILRTADKRLRTQLNGLRRVVDDAQRLFEQDLLASELRAIDGHDMVLGHLFSWTMYVAEGVRGVRALHKSGLPAHAAPLRRTLLEHGVTCWTVAQHPGAFDAYARQHRNSGARIQESMHTLGLQSADEAIALILSWEIDDTHKSLDFLVRAKDKFSKFSDGGTELYLAWLQETMMSHASYATAVLYLRDTPGDKYPTLTQAPVYAESDWSAEATCADSLLLCLQSLSSVMVNAPARRKIQELNLRKNSILLEIEELLAI